MGFFLVFFYDITFSFFCSIRFIVFVFLHFRDYGAKNDVLLAQPSISGTLSKIAVLKIDANNFEIKLNIIQMIQQMVRFDGLPHEDLNAHISNFLEVCALLSMMELQTTLLDFIYSHLL